MRRNGCQWCYLLLFAHHTVGFHASYHDIAGVCVSFSSETILVKRDDKDGWRHMALSPGIAEHKLATLHFTRSSCIVNPPDNALYDTSHAASTSSHHSADPPLAFPSAAASSPFSLSAIPRYVPPPTAARAAQPPHSPSPPDPLHTRPPPPLGNGSPARTPFSAPAAHTRVS